MMEQTGDNQVLATSTMERISILLDGEMDRAEATAVIAALCADPALRRHWHELHRVGDALQLVPMAPQRRVWQLQPRLLRSLLSRCR